MRSAWWGGVRGGGTLRSSPHPGSYRWRDIRRPSPPLRGGRGKDGGPVGGGERFSPSPTLGYDAQARAATNGWATMNEEAGIFARSDDQAADDIFHVEVSDTALEAAALAGTPGGAMSFPNAPTVSILVVCCSFDG